MISLLLSNFFSRVPCFKRTYTCTTIYWYCARIDARMHFNSIPYSTGLLCKYTITELEFRDACECVGVQVCPHTAPTYYFVIIGTRGARVCKLPARSRKDVLSGRPYNYYAPASSNVSLASGMYIPTPHARTRFHLFLFFFISFFLSFITTSSSLSSRYTQVLPSVLSLTRASHRALAHTRSASG